MDPMKIVVILVVMLFASPFILQVAAGGILISMVILTLVPLIAVLAFQSYRWYYHNKSPTGLELEYPEEDDEDGPDQVS